MEKSYDMLKKKMIEHNNNWWSSDEKRVKRSANILDPGALLDRAFGALQSVQDNAVDALKKGEDFVHDKLKEIMPGREETAAHPNKTQVHSPEGIVKAGQLPLMHNILSNAQPKSPK